MGCITPDNISTWRDYADRLTGEQHAELEHPDTR